MTESAPSINIVAFTAPHVDLTSGGAFECVVSSTAAASDLSLVVDIYDLDNSVHPEGHLGWWQFPLAELGERISGRISLTAIGVLCELDGARPVHLWVNDQKVAFSRLVVSAVLRSNITNGVVYIDKVPAFRDPGDRDMFRRRFSRNWHYPAYAPGSFVAPEGAIVRIVSRNVFLRDAVGNFCLELYRALKQNDIPVALYAEEFDLSLNDFVRRVHLISEETTPRDQLMYFSSTYDPALKTLLHLPFSRKVAYFHGITPPELLQVFDPELSMACRRAYSQIGLLQEFDVLATNSRTSREFLASSFGVDSHFSAGEIRVIPPRFLSPAARAEALATQPGAFVAGAGARLLYVGRIKSHKKIENLLELLSAYRELDGSAELWIVGSGHDKAYRDYLRWVQEKYLALPAESVKWLGSVDDGCLAQIYRTASVYVNMSEHEGFCVPIFEAMLNGLPVFTYGLPAIREVLDGAGVYFVDKNYPQLARSIKAVLDDGSRLGSIIARQKARAAELASAMDGKAMFDLLEPKLPR